MVPKVQRSPLISTSVEEPLEFKGRIYGATFLITQIGCMIGYGLSGSFYIENQSQKMPTLIDSLSLTFLHLFVIVGFGSILSLYRYANWLGFSTSITVVAVSTICGPLFQKLGWLATIEPRIEYNRFTVPSRIQDIYEHYFPQTISVSMASTKLSLISAISVLTAMTAVIGRLGFPQALRMAMIFQIAWNFNYFLCFYICLKNPSAFDDNPLYPLIFDRYGSTFIYIFASGFGLITSLKFSKPLPTFHPRNQQSGISLILCSIGTGCLISTFIFTSPETISYPNLGISQSYFSISFSIIGSICGAYGAGILLAFKRKFKISYRQALIGTISGGVIAGYSAPLLDNIGIQLCIGSVAGFFSSLYYNFIYPKINKTKIYDSLGLFGPFFISSFLGSFVLTPIILSYNRDKNQYNTGIGVISIDVEVVRWQLVYTGVSLAMGIVGALINSLFSFWDRKDSFGLYSNSRYFLNDFGLWMPPEIGAGALSRKQDIGMQGVEGKGEGGNSQMEVGGSRKEEDGDTIKAMRAIDGSKGSDQGIDEVRRLENGDYEALKNQDNFTYHKMEGSQESNHSDVQLKIGEI